MGSATSAVQLLRALAPTRIVALDTREAAVALALRAGADEAYVSRGLDPADAPGGARPLRRDARPRLRRHRRRRSRSGRRCSASAGTSRSSGSAAAASRWRSGAPARVVREPDLERHACPSSRRSSSSRGAGDISLEVERIGLEDVIATYGTGSARARSSAARWRSRERPKTKVELAGFLDTGLDLTHRLDHRGGARADARLVPRAPRPRRPRPGARSPASRLRPRPGDASSGCAGTSSRSAASRRTGRCRSASRCSSTSTPTRCSATARARSTRSSRPARSASRAPTSSRRSRSRPCRAARSRSTRWPSSATTTSPTGPRTTARAWRWPEGWAPDPDRLRSGIDLGSDELEPGELELIRGWYERTDGRRCRLMSSSSRPTAPAALKTQRARFETAVRGALPGTARAAALSVHLQRDPPLADAAPPLAPARPLARRAPRRGDLHAALGGDLRRRGRDGDGGRRRGRRPRELVGPRPSSPAPTTCAS